LRMPYRPSNSTVTEDPTRSPAGGNVAPKTPPKSEDAPVGFVANGKVSHG
jgi:hypothetical protein